MHWFFDFFISFFAGLQLYLDQKTPVLEEDPVLINNRKNKHHGHGGNGNNPSLGNSGSGSLGPAEMGLKQFSTITDLLVKLKDDLTLSFPSFIREFIGKMHALKNMTNSLSILANFGVSCAISRNFSNEKY